MDNDFFLMHSDFVNLEDFTRCFKVDLSGALKVFEIFLNDFLK